MFTRQDVVDFTVRKWCKRDLTQKGMVVSLTGDVFCIATLSGGYHDGVYYSKGIKSPVEALYFGVNSLRASGPFDIGDPETRKNIALKLTDGKTKFVYLFERVDNYSDEYFFHGRYRYIKHEFIQYIDINRRADVLFHLSYIDRPKI